MTPEEVVGRLKKLRADRELTENLAQDLEDEIDKLIDSCPHQNVKTVRYHNVPHLMCPDCELGEEWIE